LGQTVADPQTVSLSIPGSAGNTRTLLKSPSAADPAWLGRFQLESLGVFIGEVQ
jgi:hypothetical protein